MYKDIIARTCECQIYITQRHTVYLCVCMQLCAYVCVCARFLKCILCCKKASQWESTVPIRWHERDRQFSKSDEAAVLSCGVCSWLSGVTQICNCRRQKCFWSVDLSSAWLRVHLWISNLYFYMKVCALSLPQTQSLYAGSDSGVVQSPTAFCSKYLSCADCVLARDPYCAWDPNTATCVNIFDTSSQRHRWLTIKLDPLFYSYLLSAYRTLLMHYYTGYW